MAVNDPAGPPRWWAQKKRQGGRSIRMMFENNIRIEEVLGLLAGFSVLRTILTEYPSPVPRQRQAGQQKSTCRGRMKKAKAEDPSDVSFSQKRHRTEEVLGNPFARKLTDLPIMHDSLDRFRRQAGYEKNSRFEAGAERVEITST